MSKQELVYPILLDRAGIERVLPHRGDISFCQSLEIKGPHQFSGIARWPADNSVIKGHFPGMPIVPGVLLVEAMAQLVGAGLLVGDPYVKSLPQDSVGVLVAVRNCWFKQLVLPETDVSFELQCRQMGPVLVQANGQVTVNRVEVAKLDITLAYASREQLGLAQFP